MRVEKILIIPKRSKYQLDMHLLNLTSEQLLKKYLLEGVNINTILESHKAQIEGLEKLKKYFAPNQFIYRDLLTKEKLLEYELIISYGGDNHYKYVSHFIENQLLLGINSDPKRSEGALTSITSEEIDEFIPKILADNYEINNWTRIKFQINDKIGFATTEIYLGEKYRKYMSRHIITYEGNEEEQKCSGIVIATGSGSTGWFDSSVRYLSPKGSYFGNQEQLAKFIVTEPYRGKLNGSTILCGNIKKGAELKIQSLNDSNGLLITDSIEEYAFPRGTIATIKVHDIPIKVISFENK